MAAQAGDFDHAQTTLAVYKIDVPWFKQLQLDIARDRNEWISMPDVVHELITRSQEAGPQ